MIKLETLITTSTQTLLRVLAIYLSGVFHQGSGDFDTALNIFRNPCFDISQGGSSVKTAPHDMALLANMNRIWIMQHPQQRDDRETLDLIEQLRPLCESHSNVDVRTAWHNVMATITTEPPQTLNEQKIHLQVAMVGAKSNHNVHAAAQALAAMRSRLFEHVVGEQALKSGLAASKQAHRCGNMLLQSVSDGMLAHSYEGQGQQEEARQLWARATAEAVDAFSWS